MPKPTRLCDIDGCDSKHLARGLCKTHWKKQHGKPTRYPITCATCGREHMSARRDGRFCSDECKGLAYQTERRSRSRALVHVGPPDPVTWLPPQHPVVRPTKQRKPYVFYVGTCAWCGDGFTDWQPASRYCSRRCSKQAGKYKRGRFAVPNHVRTDIYERDGWVCQLCLEPVDRVLVGTKGWNPWAPSLDHIECQSWSKAPDHSPANLRLAHMWCNAVRGDERTYTSNDLRISPAA